VSASEEGLPFNELIVDLNRALNYYLYQNIVAEGDIHLSTNTEMFKGRMWFRIAFYVCVRHRGTADL
jgi:hypothetical protein